MSFAQLMAQVAGNRILGDPVLRAPWDQFCTTQDIQILQNACGSGQNIPDTELGTLYYSLVYQKQHYDAIATAIRFGAGILQHQGRCLMVDFGAGPGTAALAWAAYVKNQTNNPLSLSYVHLDQLSWMEHLFKCFLTSDPNIGQPFHWWHYAATPDTGSAAEWVFGADYALFVFSYILCQPSLTLAIVSDFARMVAATCGALGGKPAYILMVDTNLSRTYWRMLVGELGRLGMAVPSTNPSPTLDYNAIYLRPDGSVRDSQYKARKTVYDVVQIQLGA
jgi:hypothetical protein